MCHIVFLLKSLLQEICKLLPNAYPQRTALRTQDKVYAQYIVFILDALHYLFITWLQQKLIVLTLLPDKKVSENH